MRQIVEDRRAVQLEVLSGGRDTRARDARQKRLAVKAKTDRKSLGALLAELLPLVVWQARKHRGQGVDLEDLVQEGLLGVLDAVRAYTPQRGAAFATYAHTWAHGRMRRAVANHARTIRIPEYRALAAGRERKARERVQQELGRTPTDRDVAGAMGVPVAEVWRLQVETAPIESVDAMMTPADEDDLEPTEAEKRYLQDPTGDPEWIAMRKVLPEEMRKAMRKLQPRDRRVLRMRYWGELTRREITEKAGLSAKAQRHSEERGLKVLGGEKNLREYWDCFVE